MTQEQFDIIVAKLNAIARAVAPKVIDNLLVGGGEEKPAAPTVADIVANPAKYDGTQWDPINRNHRISSQLVIANFESPSKAGEFVGGTLADWAKIDLIGAWRYITSQYPGMQATNLSPSQKAFLGFPSN